LYHNGLKMTRRFFLFFFLTAILPIIILGAILLHVANNMFDEKQASLLVTDRELATSIYESDLEKLELVANQAASLTVDEKYRLFKATGRSWPLVSTLNRLQKSKDLDILALFDPKGDLVASTDLIELLFPQSLHTLFHEALQGKPTASIEQFVTRQTQKPQLYYLAVAPVFSDTSPTEVTSVLVIAQRLQDNFSAANLKRVGSEIDIAIFKEGASHPHLIFSNFPGKTGEQIPVESLSNRKPWQFKTANLLYKCLNNPLKNIAGKPIGTMAVCIPEASEAAFNQWIRLMMGISILVGLVVIIIAGWQFKRSFVTPVEAIAKTASEVTQGDLSARVPEQHAQWELQRTLQQFNRMLAQLQENETLRNTFISALTHDLRTPLLAERLVLETYQEFLDDFPPEFRPMTQNLCKSNEHLLSMVNQMLETYKYEAGKIPLVPTSVQLKKLVNNCFDRLRPLAEARQITMLDHIPESFPSFVADSDQIERILSNLIGNAIENIQEGKYVEVSASKTLDGTTQIQVRDNGPGIPAEILPRVFERFTTGPYKAKKIGSGLGLYICKLIVEHHGGIIQVASDPANGTCFTISIPEPLDIQVTNHHE